MHYVQILSHHLLWDFNYRVKVPQMYINKDILSFCVVNMADFYAFNFFFFFFKMWNHRQPKPKIIKVKS